MKYRGVAVCEGEVERDIIEFDTQAEMNAYSQGFTDGACKYGAGGAYIVCENDDLDEVCDGDNGEEIREEVNKIFGRG